MSILIKGMEMPKNCAECFFHKVFPATGVGINQLYCALCGINIVKLSDAHPDCPLVPVPPHGRLIEEADAIETAWMILRGLGYLKDENPQLEQTVREVFATAPAIEVE